MEAHITEEERNFENSRNGKIQKLVQSNRGTTVQQLTIKFGERFKIL